MSTLSWGHIPRGCERIERIVSEYENCLPTVYVGNALTRSIASSTRRTQVNVGMSSGSGILVEGLRLNCSWFQALWPAA